VVVRRVLAVTTLTVMAGTSACSTQLSDAQRAWCADHAVAVAHTMADLGLLTPIQGDSSEALWANVLADYFAGRLNFGGVDLLEAQQKKGADRGCGAAFEGR
jgi:hypothetical protein